LLEKLDAVAWAELRHAYGRASDVPGQIRALSDSDISIRDRAMWELYGNIFHQGTRYEASPHAVPFLYELLACEQTPGRAEIVELLVHLALGYAETYLPDGLDVAAWRVASEQTERQLTESEREEWMQFGVGPLLEINCYDAVRGGVPLLIDLLKAGGTSLRTAAAYGLAWFPECAEQSIPALRNLVDEGLEDGELANAILSIGLLSRGARGRVEANDAFHRALLDDDGLIVRTAAAIAMPGDSLCKRSGDVLIEAISQSDTVNALHETIRFNEGNLSGYASLVLARRGAEQRAEIVSALCRMLECVTAYHSLDVTRSILELLTGGRTEPVKIADPATLEAWESHALQAIADHGGWKLGGSHFANFSGLVGSFGLPDSQESLRRYLKGR